MIFWDAGRCQSLQKQSTNHNIRMGNTENTLKYARIPLRLRKGMERIGNGKTIEVKNNGLTTSYIK